VPGTGSETYALPEMIRRITIQAETAALASA
jgi:hypothetical protein